MGFRMHDETLWTLLIDYWFGRIAKKDKEAKANSHQPLAWIRIAILVQIKEKQIYNSKLI